MAVLCLASDITDLFKKPGLARLVVGYTYDEKPSPPAI